MADSANNSNRGLLITMIIIGIVIILLLLNPRLSLGQYAYSGNFLTASTVPIQYTRSIPQQQYDQPRGIRTYGHPTTTTYSYPVTTYQYSYTAPAYTYYPDGCTPYTMYSITTGYTCR